MVLSVDGYLKLSSNTHHGFCPPTHTHTDQHTHSMHANAHQPSQQHRGMTGMAFVVVWMWNVPFGLVSTLALQLLCAIPDCGTFWRCSLPWRKKVTGGGPGGFMTRYNFVFTLWCLTYHKLLHAMLSGLPCHERLNTSYTGVQNKSISLVASWIFDHSNKKLAQLLSSLINPFIHLFNKYSNKSCGPHCVLGTKGTPMDQTKKKILIPHMIWTLILAA